MRQPGDRPCDRARYDQCDACREPQCQKDDHGEYRRGRVRVGDGGCRRRLAQIVRIGLQTCQFLVQPSKAPSDFVDYDPRACRIIAHDAQHLIDRVEVVIEVLAQLGGSRRTVAQPGPCREALESMMCLLRCLLHQLDARCDPCLINLGRGHHDHIQQPHLDI